MTQQCFRCLTKSGPWEPAPSRYDPERVRCRDLDDCRRRREAYTRVMRGLRAEARRMGAIRPAE